MANQFRKGIYESFIQKGTDELVEIWKRNDRIEWTEIALDVVREILLERLGELPEQDTPFDQHEQEREEDKLIIGEELIGSENSPVFYDPEQVLWLSKWMNRAAIAMIVLITIQNLLQLRTEQRLVFSFSPYNQNFIPWSWLIAFIGLVLLSVLESILLYFPLKALGYILRILMDMEFLSRRVK